MFISSLEWILSNLPISPGMDCFIHCRESPAKAIEKKNYSQPDAAHIEVYAHTFSMARGKNTVNLMGKTTFSASWSVYLLKTYISRKSQIKFTSLKT